MVRLSSPRLHSGSSGLLLARHVGAWCHQRTCRRGFSARQSINRMCTDIFIMQLCIGMQYCHTHLHTHTLSNELRSCSRRAIRCTPRPPRAWLPKLFIFMFRATAWMMYSSCQLLRLLLLKILFNNSKIFVLTRPARAVRQTSRRSQSPTSGNSRKLDDLIPYYEGLTDSSFSYLFD